MNTPNMMREDVENAGFLDSSEFEDYTLAIHDAIKKLGRPIYREIREELGLLFNRDRFEDAVGTLKARGLVAEIRSGDMTRLIATEPRVLPELRYNGNPIPPSVKRPDAEVFEDRHRVTA